MNYFKELKNYKMLLVDDDDFIRDSLSIVFKNNGCSIRTAETAEEGLRALNLERFHVIISDLRLPGIDGLEFFRLVHIYQADALGMLITAYRDKGIALKAAAMGIHEYIEKPFSVELLVESLARLVKRQTPQ